MLTINDLPPPPSGKTGWPWTVQSDPLPELMPDGSNWPRISIVTPSYNQGQFIEETIRSVLLQSYPNLEYIIIDGGSADNTVDVIKKYCDWIKYCVSEKDGGQANAINKGLAKCSGTIFNWINSDDFLTPNCLHLVAKYIVGADAIAGAVRHFSDSEERVVSPKALSIKGIMLCSPGIIYQQPSAWFRTNNVRSLNGVSEQYNYCFDWDLAIRYIAKFHKVKCIPSILANFRLHDCSKTVTQADQFEIETQMILTDLLRDISYKDIHKDINLRFRWKKWHLLIKKIAQEQSFGKKKKIALILYLSFLDPRMRYTRFTLGAIRRILLS